MLSIAIKNSLLIILIILILHFMLKNYMLETRPQRKAQVAVEPKPEPFVEAQVPSPSELPSSEKRPLESAAPAPVQPVELESMKIEEDELYKFVFNEECKIDDSTFLPEPATIKLAKQPKDDAMNFDTMILSEYENENTMNGGTLFGSLSGFDSMANDYVPYHAL